ncbi:MAG: 50S ribosomal protein L25 [Dehalococcoidia bacterium]
MTTQAVRLEVDPRETLGKKVKQLRRAGTVPVHLYGPGVDDRALQCEQRTLVRALSQAGGNTPIVITVQGESGEQLTFAREIQWDPVRGDILHVDFLAVSATVLVTAQVPIVLSGESPGAREAGGAAVQALFTIDVEALPLEMPGQVDIDLEELVDPNGTIRVQDIQLPGNVTVLTDPEATIVRIEVARVEEVEVAEEVEGEEVAEGAEPEAEAPAEAPSDTAEEESAE